jgi:hypothetical protein
MICFYPLILYARLLKLAAGRAYGAPTDIVGISVEAFRADWACTDVVGASVEACRADGASTDVVDLSVKACRADWHPLMLCVGASVEACRADGASPLMLQVPLFSESFQELYGCSTTDNFERIFLYNRPLTP